MRRALSVAFVLLVACSGNGEETPSSSATPSDGAEVSPTVTVTVTASPTPSVVAPTCPEQQDSIEDPALQQPGRLTGDLEDDGAADEVYLVVDRDGEPGCQAFLVAESDTGSRSVPIEVVDIPFDLGFPRLIAMPLIDDRPGAEVVVGVLAGASTQFAAVYTAVDGDLVQVRREGAERAEDSLLAFGGSVGHQDAFDCAPEVGQGVVVVSSAEPVGGGARFRYVRRFFVSPEPGVVAEDPSLREEGTVRFNRFDTLHEFPNAPFGSCSTGEIAG
jgi:hypothetical protein